jgi:hypothetical protein
MLFQQVFPGTHLGLSQSTPKYGSGAFRKNCHTFSAGFSSGLYAGRNIGVTLVGQPKLVFRHAKTSSARLDFLLP